MDPAVALTVMTNAFELVVDLEPVMFPYTAKFFRIRDSPAGAPPRLPRLS